jgi:hypothetical protein
MALKLSSIKRELSNDGEWVDIPEWTGVRFKTRSIYSRDYQIAREMLVQKLARQLGRLPTSPEMEPALGKLVARHLLRGWDGIVDGNPEAPVEWTPDVGLEYLSNREYVDLEQQVIWAATRVGERDAEFTVDAVKNSDAPSATS